MLWFIQEGWVVVLAVLNLALALFIFLRQHQHDRRIKTIEWRFSGLIERISGAYQKIDTVNRRVTGKLEIGNEDDTKLKKAMKKIKPEDFDDK